MYSPPACALFTCVPDHEATATRRGAISSAGIGASSVYCMPNDFHLFRSLNTQVMTKVIMAPFRDPVRLLQRSAMLLAGAPSGAISEESLVRLCGVVWRVEARVNRLVSRSDADT